MTNTTNAGGNTNEQNTVFHTNMDASNTNQFGGTNDSDSVNLENGFCVTCDDQESAVILANKLAKLCGLMNMTVEDNLLFVKDTLNEKQQKKVLKIIEFDTKSSNITGSITNFVDSAAEMVDFGFSEIAKPAVTVATAGAVKIGANIIGATLKACTKMVNETVETTGKTVVDLKCDPETEKLKNNISALFNRNKKKKASDRIVSM